MFLLFAEITKLTKRVKNDGLFEQNTNVIDEQDMKQTADAAATMLSNSFIKEGGRL